MPEPPATIRRENGSRSAGPFFLLLLLCLPAACSRDTGLPNIVFITIDTLRGDRLGCTGHAAARTPVLDRLAKGGVLFDNCIVTAPITLPSHASMMTGLYPFEMGIRDNRPDTLAPEADTLAEALKQRGYTTLAVVSGEPLAPGCGLEQGFDRYLFRPKRRSGTALLLEAPADATTELAMEALSSGQPFFLWVHYFDPHHPYEPPVAHDDPYDGEITFVDQQIGRLLNHLKTEGMLDSTWIAVTSDHGEGLGDHGEPTHAFFLYDTTVKVPLIVKSPFVKGGRTCHARILSKDFKDLFLGLALGVPAPAVRDLIVYLTEEGAEPASKAAFSESLYCQRSFHWAQMTSLRTGGATLVRGARDEGMNVTEAMRREMDRFKANASRRIEKGPLFQMNLPGYFGSSARGGDAFLGEEENQALPHPPDRTVQIAGLLEAVALASSGNLNRARQLLDALADEDPANPTVLFWRARVMREQGVREGDSALIRQAYSGFREAMKTAPGSSDAFFMSTWCLIQLGEFDAALAELDQWTKSHAPTAKTWELYGYLHLTKLTNRRWNPHHDLERAFQCFDRSLEMEGNNPRLLRDLVEKSVSLERESYKSKYQKRLEALEKEGWQR
jgi:hypothetical protein